MRPIDADTLYINLVKMKDFGELTAKKAIRVVENAPTVDAEPVASRKTVSAIGRKRKNKRENRIDRC